jgi:hypothetical protein
VILRCLLRRKIRLVRLVVLGHDRRGPGFAIGLRGRFVGSKTRGSPAAPRWWWSWLDNATVNGQIPPQVFVRAPLKGVESFNLATWTIDGGAQRAGAGPGVSGPPH